MCKWRGEERNASEGDNIERKFLIFPSSPEHLEDDGNFLRICMEIKFVKFWKMVKEVERERERKAVAADSKTITRCEEDTRKRLPSSSSHTAHTKKRHHNNL